MTLAHRKPSRVLRGSKGQKIKRELSQFYTPDWLAKRMWTWATQMARPETVLEPSAGQGALIFPMASGPGPLSIVAIEKDADNAGELVKLSVQLTKTSKTLRVVCADFMDVPVERVDLVVGNPPYEHGQDVAFVMQSLLWSDRVVMNLPSAVLFGKWRQDYWRQRFSLPRLAILSDRPDYGGDSTPMTNYVVAEVVPKRPGIDVRTKIEWW